MKRIRLLAAASAVALSLVLVAPAGALTVHDPWNYSQNLLAASRALEQIRNQIASLQNEAQMLVNQARNLTSLPYSSLQQLRQSMERTQTLLNDAQRIAFDVEKIEEAFRTSYGEVPENATDQALIEGARERWQNSVAAFEDALKVQAGVVGNLETTRAEMDALLSASQSAQGALQAAQAGNQLTALQARQLADLTALLAAQGRAQALEQARHAAREEQAREQLRRFLAPGAANPSTNVRMFQQ